MGGRYDNRVTEVILERVNILDLVGEYVQLKRAGRSHKGLCPFHNEKTPSFNVSEDKQFYHCFGCGAGGDAIKFIQQIENLDFIDALEYLADKYQVDLEPYRMKVGKKQQASMETRSSLQGVSREAGIFFIKQLKKNSDAMTYLKNRGLSDETIKRFGLGFAPDGWHNLLDNYRRNPAKLKLLEQAGLIVKSQKKNNYYDYFRNRIMFPIIDIKGKVIGFGGRVMDNSQPKYLNSPETEIFNKSTTLYGLNLAKHVLSKERRVIVTEGYMDVIALHQQGIENAVATLGTALTEQHGHVLSRYADEIIICYDADAAGRKAALRSVSVLRGIQAKVKILTLGEDLDPDDYVKKYGVEGFQRKLDEAVPATEYQLNLAAEGLDLDTDEGRIDYVKRAVEVLKTIPEAVERDVYLKHVVQETGVNESVIRRELGAASSKGKMEAEEMPEYMPGEPDIPPSLEQAVVGQSTRRDNDPLRSVERRLMDIAISSRQGYRALMEVLDPNDLHYKNIRSIFDFLESYYRDHEVFDPNAAAELLDLSLVKGLRNRLQSMIAISDVHKEIASNMRMHKKLILEKQVQTVRKERERIMRMLRRETADMAEQKEELRRLIREEQQLNEQISKLVRERT